MNHVVSTVLGISTTLLTFEYFRKRKLDNSVEVKPFSTIELVSLMKVDKGLYYRGILSSVKSSLPLYLGTNGYSRTLTNVTLNRNIGSRKVITIYSWNSSAQERKRRTKPRNDMRWAGFLLISGINHCITN